MLRSTNGDHAYGRTRDGQVVIELTAEDGTTVERIYTPQAAADLAAGLLIASSSRPNLTREITNLIKAIVKPGARS